MKRLPDRQPRVRRSLALAIVLLLPAGTTLAALQADNEPENLVAQGEFEGAVVSLRLPAVGAFPLIVGGWGTRGDDAARIGSSAVARSGLRALEIASSEDAPVHALQAGPVATRSWVLELAVQRLRGRQVVRLLHGWNRVDPLRAEASVEILMTAGGFRIATPAGNWQIRERLGPEEWARLRLVADARDEQLHVWIDDRLVASLPGLAATPPSTLVLGGADGRGDSRYRYDEIRLHRLAEVELAEIRRQSLRWVPAADLAWVMERFGAAARTLARGASRLAEPELRAALRLLEGSRPQADDAAGMDAVRASTQRLLELVAAS